MELEDPMQLGLWHWNISLPIASWAKCDDNEVYEVGAGDTLLFSGGQICISWINSLLSGSSIFKKKFLYYWSKWGLFTKQNHDIPILWHQKREKGKGRNSFSHTHKKK